MKLKIKPLLASIAFVTLSTPLHGYAQANTAHHQDYQAALELVASSEDKLIAAMHQLQSGQVAHYDFLQFEHIELVRHSRALVYPPSDVADSSKALIQDEARALLNSAESLEWIISDFLRAMAQVRSATNNTLDIAHLASANATDAQAVNLAELQAACTGFSAAAFQEGWEDLAAAYDRVLESELTQQTRRELQFQKERLGLYAQQLNGFIQKLAESDVDERAEQLMVLYQAAT